MARKPRAPVFRLIASSAIASSASGGEVEVDVLEVEHLAVLLDQRVAGLGKDLDEGFAFEMVHCADNRHTADELRDQAELGRGLRAARR